MEDKISNQPEQLNIDIDFERLIKLLSHNLYKDPTAVLRELLSNANDALFGRREEGSYGEDVASVRIWLDAKAGKFTIKDNGIGMSKQELINYLATIGASLAEERSNAYSLNSNAFEQIIGRFGIGFLSSFVVADVITVETRRHDASEGNRWESHGKRTYTIAPHAGLSTGTTITLKLKPLFAKQWTQEYVRGVILENSRNFLFPIFWGLDGHEQLNQLQAPWYSETPPGEKDDEAVRLFLSEYDERFSSILNAAEIIMLRTDDLCGAIYIAPRMSELREKTSGIDIYCKRVLVKKNDTDFMPPEFPWIKGVLDCKAFNLTAARDEVIHDHVYNRIREHLAIRILDHIVGLAKKAAPGKRDGPYADVANDKRDSYRVRLQVLMDSYHWFVKEALSLRGAGRAFRYPDSYLNELEDAIPFQTSSYPTSTLKEYLDRLTASGREREILVTYLREDVTAQRLLSEQEKREFIILRLPQEKGFLDRYADFRRLILRPASEVLKESVDKAAITGGWDRIVRYYKERLSHPEFTLSVYLATFQPDTIPGRLLADKTSEGQKRIEESISDFEKDPHFDSNDPVYLELKKVRQKQPHLLYLNKRHPTLAKISGAPGDSAEDHLDLILHSIFHDIVVAAGHSVHEAHMTEYQTKVYSEIIDSLDTRVQLSKKLEEGQVQLNALQQELLKLRRSPDPTSREVFFIRPMGDGSDEYDKLAEKIRQVCEKCGLTLIDPKQLQMPIDILHEISMYLQSARIVVADVSEVNNPNVFYEAGYVHGHYPEKLVLIADSRILRDKRLPFDIAGKRVAPYSNNVWEFDAFLVRFESIIREMVATRG